MSEQAGANLVGQVQAMYAAFERGDLASILSHLADEVDWATNVSPEVPGCASSPAYRPCHGRAAVPQFFESNAASFEFHRFAPRAFLTNGQEVAVTVEFELTARRTGRRFSTEAMHLWTFDADGQVVRFREFEDTALVIASQQG